MLVLLCAVPPALADDAQVAAGRRLYRDGMRPSGAPLVGLRADGGPVTGAQAACIQCHRPSGMGGAEGTVHIPPVVAARLLAPGRPPAGSQPRVAAGLQRQELASRARPAHDADSLHRALTTGIGPGGAPLGGLMPRYTLDPDEVRSLLAYLRTLDPGPAPGVTSTHIHLATVVSDQAPADERQAVLDLLHRCLEPTSTPGWRLHTWTLRGDPSGWPAQLAARQARQPVFALVSGLSPKAWRPVQAFCEREQMPCVLPNTASVDPTLGSDWSFHFSRGVALEASLAEEDLRARGIDSARRVLQWTDASEAARLGARVLRERLADTGVSVETLAFAGPRLPPGAGQAIGGLRPGDALVLWLPPAALQALSGSMALPAGVNLYVSAEIGGLEAVPLAPAWQGAARLLYGYEQPQRRIARQIVNTRAWLPAGQRPSARLALLLGNTYSACEMTRRALRGMGGQASRLWFLELIEAAEESALATAYPRFTLGPGQRVGSRGGLLMQADPARPRRLVPVDDWRVPDWSTLADAKPGGLPNSGQNRQTRD